MQPFDPSILVLISAVCFVQMKKIFVLDTNVVLHDPTAIFQFHDNDVVLPITIIEELDRFKKQGDVTGRNAREVSRHLDNLRQQGNLTTGIHLDNGSVLTVMLCDQQILNSLPPELSTHLADNVILAVALKLKQQCECPVVLVSKDTNLRIKADALNLKAEDYQTDKVNISELYTGTTEILVKPEQIEEFFQVGKIPADTCLLPNQGVTLIDNLNPSHTALGMADYLGKYIIALRELPPTGISHIRPRNREQRFVMNLLLDDNISLVTLVGKAGTGKTLLAIAAGLKKVADEKHYSRLLIARPIVPMGKDIGYLPGDIKEKLTPWMQPLYDNFDLIFASQDPLAQTHIRHRTYQELIDFGLLQIEPLTYIRGRTIPQQFFIVDEAQNLTPHEVKSIITRAGEGTKIVMTGDPDQIDNPYVDAASNGLIYTVERFKQEPIAGHITLSKGERSPLAERATALL